MVAVNDRACEPGLIEQHLQHTLALNLRRISQVEAFKEKKVEGVERHAPPSAAGERSLKLREVGAAILDDDDLAIEDGALDRDIETFRDEVKAVGPVVTIAGEDFHLTLVEMNLEPIAVEFDFVNPLVSRRRLSLSVASWGGINPGISEGLAPSIIRAMKRALVRLTIKNSKKYRRS
jgi:hypothetical protein